MPNVFRRLGGKVTAAKFFTYAALHRIGYLSQTCDVDWARVERLVFVCSGNICRSPYAAEVCRLMGLKVASLALHGRGGSLANSDAIRVADLEGVDLRHHRSINVRDFEFRSNDLVIGMEPSHYRELRKLLTLPAGHLTLLGLWHPNRFPLVPDPYGLGDECFANTFSLIRVATERMLTYRDLALRS